MSTQPTESAQRLRDSGLRVTASRHAVLEWLIGHPHATAEQVYNGVGERIGSVSKQAIYDVLAACVNAGLVRQIKPAGHPAHFERRTRDNHHHLVCRRCARIEDTDCHTQTAPCLEPSDDAGFEIEQAEIIFWGLCADCRSDSAHANGSSD